MGNRKINLEKTSMQKVQLQSDTLYLEDFFSLQEKFIQEKSLEGLRKSSIQLYLDTFRFFNEYVESAYESEKTNMQTGKDLLNSYVYEMSVVRKYSNYTCNIRIRTIRTYLRWLFPKDI